MVHRYDLHVDIARPLPDVWHYVTDLERTPEWRTTITTIEPPGELAVGAPFTGTTRLLGRTWHWRLAVLAVDAPHHFAYVVTHGVAKPTVEYRLDPTATGTRFTMSGHIDEMNVVARLIQPLALRSLRRETRIHLDQLRRILETSE